MQIATDNTGTVRLVGDSLPSEWNGIILTLHTLSAEQAQAYSALRANRVSTMYSGGVFTAVGVTE